MIVRQLLSALLCVGWLGSVDAGIVPAPEERPTLSFLPVPAGWSSPWWSKRDVKLEDITAGQASLSYLSLKPSAVLRYQTTSVESGYDLSAIPPQKISVRLCLPEKLVLRLTIYNGKDMAVIEADEVTRKTNGTFRYVFSFDQVRFPLNNFQGFALQFMLRPTTKTMKISDFGLYVNESGFHLKNTPTPPEVTDYLNALDQPAYYENDNRPRPEIRNGTWHLDRDYHFFIGPNVNGNPREWQVKNMLTGKHPAYTEPPSKKILSDYGFNTAEICVKSFMGRSKSGYGTIRDFVQDCKRIETFIRSFNDYPIVMDFSDVYREEVEHAVPTKYPEIKQQNESWCHFIPLCPEHPDGRKFYTDFMETGTRMILKNGGNPFLYELLNETKYNCQCRYNVTEFSRQMKEKYGTIETANRQWQTSFATWDEMSEIRRFSLYPRMVPDWQKFISARYAEILREYQQVIRRIDHRKNIYFTEQLAQGVLLRSGDCMGMDYRKIADAIDVLGSEGGWRSFGYGSLKYGGIMEDAATSGNSYSFLADIFQALAKGRKPIMNLEHYCGRFEDGKRVSSLKSDISTAMWLEIMHGVSGSYWYVWGGWFGELQSWADAVKQGQPVSWKSYMMLNPYNWPLNTLDGFDVFQRELKPYQNQVLPFPRTGKPSVAIFFSYPTLLMARFNKENYREKMLAWYNAVLFHQYPLAIVFEEELENLDPAIQALILPSASYATPETLHSVERFIRRGGTVIADRQALTLDEYGSPQKSPIREKLFRLDANNENETATLIKLLEKNRIRRYGTVEARSGAPLEQTELHLIDRKDFKLCLIVNMEYLASRDVTIKLNIEDDGNFYLTDAINLRTLLPATGETWTAATLREGVDYTIPAQERVLLILEKKRPAGTTVLTPADRAELSRRIHAMEAEKLNKHRSLQNQKQQEQQQRTGAYQVDPRRCYALDLKKFVNRGFADTVAGDGKGGWFDDGPENDFAGLKTGEIIGAGVPFSIIDPEKNNGKGALVLLSLHATFGVPAAKGIPVARKVNRIFFLHTSGWNVPNHTVILKYRINYADGTMVEIPIRAGFEIGNWWGTPEIKNAKFAVHSETKSYQPINLQAFGWTNPQQNKKIDTLDIISTNTDSIPAVVAISVEE